MSDLVRTTVYLDATEYRHLKARAEREGRSAAELIREAVAEYAGKDGGRSPRPRSIGAARSGCGDLSERSEELLEGMGRVG